MKQSDILAIARTQLGKPYVFGARVDKTDPDPPSWDCAELVTWAVYQITGKLYGCIENNAAPEQADAYTGAWRRDAREGRVHTTLLEVAMGTPGMILLRNPTKERGGHIAIVGHDGLTCEAHSKNDGVCERQVAGRAWDVGIRIPGVD